MQPEIVYYYQLGDIPETMKGRKPRLNDHTLRWTGMALLSLLYTTAVNLPAVLEEHRSWVKQYLTDFIFMVVCWTIAREVIIMARRLFPGIKNTRRRIAMLFVSTVLLSFVEGFLIVYFLNYTNYYEFSFNLTDFFYTGGLILVFSMMIMAVYESLYSLGEWNKLAVEAEALKRENLQSQLDSLKEQVKPHFLFNALSTLIGLIDEDKTRAKKFVEELAFVYRYLLQSNEKMLIPLADELAFIKAYYYLLKTRFDDRLVLDIYVGKEKAQWLIPPLTLQILLENAVKHNTISPEKPLHVVITEEDNHCIAISNTLQRRTQSVISTQTGLANLAAKYQLMQQPTPEIFETPEKYTVLITLIPNPTS